MALRIPEPESDEVKEVYAFYGLAMYYAQVLEQEMMLCTAALVASGQSVLVPGVVRALYDSLETKTFGQVLSAARGFLAISPEVDRTLADALRRRNILAHRFFSENAKKALSQRGRTEMIAQLRADTSLFQAADAHLTAIREPLLLRFGITPQMVEEALAEMKRQASVEDGA